LRERVRGGGGVAGIDGVSIGGIGSGLEILAYYRVGGSSDVAEGNGGSGRGCGAGGTIAEGNMIMTLVKVRSTS